VPKVSPFKGVRFDPDRVELSRALCPPYDAISQPLARKLRRVPENAIHIELPAGPPASRYRKAAAAWKSRLSKGLLVLDDEPCLYAVEQRFVADGRDMRRVGLLAALGVDDESASRVLAHERTLSKPKEDRMRLLEALRVNTSPIFAIFSDETGEARAALLAARQREPLWSGKDCQGVEHRLWRVGGALARGIPRVLEGKTFLIADGHHRYEVSREFFKRTAEPGAEATLAYLCPEEDPGLLVMPTHRVMKPGRGVRESLAAALLSPMPDDKALESALESAMSPYAFGLYDGSFRLGLPAPGCAGATSGFGTDWLARNILAGADPQEIRYFHSAPEAVEDARRTRSWAFLLKRFAVADIRRAVQAAGLLPQKSTYFIPKVPTGLVFRAFGRP